MFLASFMLKDSRDAKLLRICMGNSMSRVAMAETREWHVNKSMKNTKTMNDG